MKLTRRNAHLLDLDARTLLRRFGAGHAAPGSGSAAAFNGALSCAMIASAARHTRRVAKPHETGRRQKAIFILKQIETKWPRLEKLVQKDSEVFETVIEQRKAAMRAKDPNKKAAHQKRARAKLITATNLVVKVARECVGIARLGMQMVEIGYAAARGEPASGVTNALSGAQSALFVALLNVQKYRTKHAQKTRREIEQLQIEVLELQAQLLRVVAGMAREGRDEDARQMRLFS